MTRHLLFGLAGLLLISHAITAQNQSGRRTVDSPAPEFHGTFHPIVDYVPPPQSLKDLVKRSDVIVDGTVQSVFPSRLRSADDPTSVETDTLFTIDRVLKGKPEVLRSLVIARMGGKYGDVEVIIDSEPPFMPGDRHILFLHYDRRTIVPTYPRTDGNFAVMNGSFGNFKVEGDAVKWLNRYYMEPFSKFQNGTADDFIAQILAEGAAAQ
jgi:hypothetical protein